MMRSRLRRPGFTLLEVLLATVIALVLLAALYVTMDVMLNRMDAHRTDVANHDLSRAVVGRMGADLSTTLGPLQPKSGGGTSTTVPVTGTTTSTSTTSSATTSTATTSTATGTTGTGTTGSTEVTDTVNPDADSQIAADVPLQAGVVGYDKQLTIFLSRVPTALSDPTAAATSPTGMLPADLRRVTYYLAADGGLCRQERPWVTADGIRNSAEPDRTDEAGDRIAPEVVDVTFDYFDGDLWLPSWDGSEISTDGKSAVGPPRAVRATFVLASPGRGGATVQKTVQHVFAVRSAVGAYLPPPEETTTDPAATDPATTGTSTTGGM